MSATIDIAEIIAQTDAAKAPVRLEYVRGRTKWEASPASRHQKALQHIERSLRPIPGRPEGCACFVLADTLIRFDDPDRSIKRPDLFRLPIDSASGRLAPHITRSPCRQDRGGRNDRPYESRARVPEWG